jgi:hypothetical protein
MVGSVSIVQAQAPFQRQITSIQARKARLDTKRTELLLRADANDVQLRKLKQTYKDLKNQPKGIGQTVALKQLLRAFEAFSTKRDSFNVEKVQFLAEEQQLLSDVIELKRRVEAQNRTLEQTSPDRNADVRRSIQREIDRRN